jgi:CRP-like cAMP-binding protein
LKTVPLLGDLNDSELHQIVAFFTTITLRAGQTLYAEGSAANSACFVIDGELDAFAKLPGGGEAMVGTILPGTIIGEMALLNGGRRTASVRARTEARALEVSAAFFQASLGQMDLPAYKILRRVIRDLTERLSEVRDKIITHMEQLDPESAAVSTAGASRGDPVGHSGEASFDFRPYLPLLPFFRHFHQADTDRFLALGKLLEMPGQSQLYEEGAEATSAYLVVRGAVECTVWRGGKKQLAVIGPGRICGANEIIGRRSRKNSAGTRSGSLLLELEREAFERLFTGETPECLQFQNAIGNDQLNDLKSANNLLALLVSQAHIRAGQQMASVSEGTSQGP